MLVQASFSIFWSLLALCTMVIATRVRLRPLWLAGAGLMALVVVKLFFLDLPTWAVSSGSSRFMGVGLLMLMIGYFSPVPPAGRAGGKMTGWSFSDARGIAVGAAERAQDFAYGMPIEADGEAALYEIEIPAAVYRTVTRSDLGDIRVFNGQGEVVPHALKQSAAA